MWNTCAFYSSTCGNTQTIICSSEILPFWLSHYLFVLFSLLLPKLGCPKTRGVVFPVRAEFFVVATEPFLERIAGVSSVRNKAATILSPARSSFSSWVFSSLPETYFLFFSFPFHSPVLPLITGLPLRSCSFNKVLFLWPCAFTLLCPTQYQAYYFDCPSVIQFQRLMLKPGLHYKLLLILRWVLCCFITLLLHFVRRLIASLKMSRFN